MICRSALSSLAQHSRSEVMIPSLLRLGHLAPKAFVGSTNCWQVSSSSQKFFSGGAARWIQIKSSAWEDLPEEKRKKIVERRRKRQLAEAKKQLANNIQLDNKGNNHNAAKSSPSAADTLPQNVFPMRVAKRIALSSPESRRQATELVKEGRVTINGEIVRSLGQEVQADDAVAVDGQTLPSIEPIRVFLVNKLAGELVTRVDPQGRATIIDRLRSMNLPRNIIPVGRLDYKSEGLILFVNSGDLARAMEHPKSNIRREYRVRVYGKIKEYMVEKLARGVTVDNVRYEPINVRVDSTKGPESWLSVTLKEGKNREIRKVLAYFGMTVTRLIRTRYGPYSLGDLPKGSAVEVRLKGKYDLTLS